LRGLAVFAPLYKKKIMGFTSALTLLFIGLKLGDVINWGWIAVLSPPIVWIVLYTIVFMFVNKSR